MGVLLDNVDAGYSKSKLILKSVSADFSEKTIVIGPNSSGKTTLFRAIMGLTPILRGNIFIDDVHIDVVRQQPRLISTNLKEVYLSFGMAIREVAYLYLDLMSGDKDKFDDLVKEFSIEKEAKKNITVLSAGTKTLFLNCIALSSNSKYILLDEPFENIDPSRRALLLRELSRTNSIVIVNTHATWLLNHLRDWKSYIMVKGKLFGPLKVNDILSAKLSKNKTSDVILEIDMDREKIYLTKSVGVDLSSLDSLDKLYEVITW